MRGRGDRTRSAASEISTSASGLGFDHAHTGLHRQPAARCGQLLPAAPHRLAFALPHRSRPGPLPRPRRIDSVRVVPTRDDPELAALFAWRRKVDDPVEAGLTVATAWAALNDRVGADITFTRAGTAPIRRRWLLPIDTDVAWLTAAGSAAFLLITEADAARQCAPWPVGLPFGGYPSQALAGAVARMTLARARSRGAVNEAVTRGNVGSRRHARRSAQRAVRRSRSPSSMPREPRRREAHALR